jgi:6-phosphogluconolactonase
MVMPIAVAKTRRQGHLGSAPLEATRTMTMAEIEVFPDKDALVRAAAERFIALADETSRARGRCLVALSGGSTPKPLYELLAAPSHAGRVDWSRLHLFWGDERCVPPDHPDSNYRMTREALIDRVPIPAANVHRIRGEDEPQAAADAYDRLLRDVFGHVGADAPARSFDLALLGMGPDGHTASMFPGTAATTEARRWATAVHVERPHEMWRVTLTTVVLNAAANVTFLVAGADKTARVREILRADGAPRPPLPAQLIKPAHGVLRWMVDAAAGAGLAAR